jgi:cytochrome c
MKKLLVILSMGCLAVACGGGNENAEKKEGGTEETKETTAEPKKNPDYEKGLALVAKSDCFTCHDVSTKKVGPAYKDVAAKYQESDAVVDSLANKVIKGGSGNWGQIAMTPHPQLSKDDAKTMVKYVLSLKK